MSTSLVSVETVLRSTPLLKTNGPLIDKDGHLVIASVNGRAIYVMDTDTGKILKKYTHPTLLTGADDVEIATRKTRVLAENVGGPNSTAFGPDGRMYSPVNLTGEIIRWNLDTGEREVVLREVVRVKELKKAGRLQHGVSHEGIHRDGTGGRADRGGYPARVTRPSSAPEASIGLLGSTRTV